MADVPLVAPSDLTGFPGAPFAEGVVAAAAGQVRVACRWHVAPVLTETVVIETGGASVAVLPSLRVVSVSEVRDEDGNVLTGWRLSPAAPVLRYGSGWPDVIEVDIQHGHESCPPELLAVVAELASAIKGGRVKAESLAGRSVQLDTTPGSMTSDVIASHSLPERP